MENFHVGVTGPRNPQAVREALEAAGFTVQDIVETTHEHGGIIMTARMAGYTWNSQTGAEDCDGSCRKGEETPHRKLEELSEEQYREFVTRVLELMNEHRGEMDMDLGAVARLGPPAAIQGCA